jgi:hypothetical protein
MEIMRHSDMRQTAKTYSLTRLTNSLTKFGPAESFPVRPRRNDGDLIGMQHANKQHPTNDMSGPVTTGQENANWSGRQDYPAFRRALQIWASPGRCANAQAVEPELLILSQESGRQDYPASRRALRIRASPQRRARAQAVEPSFSSCRKNRGDRIRTRSPRLIIRPLGRETHKETHKAQRSSIPTCSGSLTHGAISRQTSRLRSWQSLARILSHTGEAIIWQNHVQRLKGRHAGNLALFRNHRSDVLR